MYARARVCVCVVCESSFFILCVPGRVHAPRRPSTFLKKCFFLSFFFRPKKMLYVPHFQNNLSRWRLLVIIQPFLSRVDSSNGLFETRPFLTGHSISGTSTA